jgi:hypothetical protein
VDRTAGRDHHRGAHGERVRLPAGGADGRDGAGGAAAGSVPPRSASELYFARVASAASESDVAFWASGVVAPAGRSGMPARSGFVPSAFAEGAAVSGGKPPESAAGAGAVSPIRSSMVEHALVHRATVSTAARRTKVLVMLSFLSLIGILTFRVYRRALRLPSGTPCQIDEILWQKGAMRRLRAPCGCAAPPNRFRCRLPQRRPAAA